MEAKQRLISLHGFFSLSYPAHWKNEIDDSGNYLFYDDTAGSGVARIMLFDKPAGFIDSSAFLEDVFAKHLEYDAGDTLIGDNRFISYVQVHDINGSEFHVYYWTTCYKGKVILFTYTVQSMMKDLPTGIEERRLLLEIMSGFTFLKEQPHQ